MFAVRSFGWRWPVLDDLRCSVSSFRGRMVTICRKTLRIVRLGARCFWGLLAGLVRICSVLDDFGRIWVDFVWTCRSLCGSGRMWSGWFERSWSGSFRRSRAMMGAHLISTGVRSGRRMVKWLTGGLSLRVQGDKADCGYSTSPKRDSDKCKRRLACTTKVARRPGFTWRRLMTSANRAIVAARCAMRISGCTRRR